MACSCGYVNKVMANPTLTEESKTNESIEIVDDKEEEKNLSVTDEECVKCGHDKAYYFMVQTRASDEAETKFLTCTSCSHRWRDYS